MVDKSSCCPSAGHCQLLIDSYTIKIALGTAASRVCNRLKEVKYLPLMPLIFADKGFSHLRLSARSAGKSAKFASLSVGG